MSGCAAVFLDGAYLDKVLESLGRLRLDYEKFSEKACRGTARMRS